MAETLFSKLDHRAPLARAEVNRIGTGWNDPAARVDRSDNTTYLPLQMPGVGNPSPSQTEPAPPPPTESELREVLAQTIASKQFADDQLARAQASAARAALHVAQCKSHVATFDDLDDQITERTVEALRSGDGRPRGGMDDDLRLRVAERDVARASAAAAERAQAVLDVAALEASVEADHAAQAARRAAVAVAAIEAQRLAERVIALEDEAERTRELVRGFDRAAANTGLALPTSVFTVVTADGGAALMRPVDATAWQAALDRLLADATAEVSVPIPEPRPKPVLRYSHEVRHAVPIRRPEPEPEATITPLPEPEAAAP